MLHQTTALHECMPHSPRLVILGVAESDAHVVANQLIAFHLQAEGFVVINLGACTPLEEFIKALRKYPTAEALIIGSLNGHAYEDLKGLRDAKDDLLIACPVIVGGNLGVTQAQRDQMAAALKSIGVDFLLESRDDLVDLLHGLPRRNSQMVGIEV